jgi:hypothetical protein
MRTEENHNVLINIKRVILKLESKNYNVRATRLPLTPLLLLDV